MRFFYLVLLLATCSACTPLKSSAIDPLEAAKTPLKPEQAAEVLGTYGGNVAYGTGLGDGAAKIASVAVFPPFGLVLLGNAVLSLSGYEPITISRIMPDSVSEAYDSVVAVPGRVTAALAGKEFRRQEIGEQKIKKIFDQAKERNQIASLNRGIDDIESSDGYNRSGNSPRS